MGEEADPPLIAFVKALARGQARIDADVDLTGGHLMPQERPSITSVNGYDVIEVTPRPVFRVYDDDRQYGPDFKSFDEAAEHARSLPSRKAPRR
jgi:hypothetical protein